MKAFLCELLFTCVLAAPGARSIDELAYGNMLFAYFQADHEAALLEVMVAQRRGQLGADPARFALAGGSLAFAEGLYGMADTAFAGLDPGALSDVNQMRLAFHRARALYRAGDWDRMAAALDTIRFDPTWLGRQRYHPEILFMRAEAALAAGDFAAAERALQPLPADTDFLGYGLFNLAVAQRAAGAVDGARAALERLAELPLESDTGRDLVARGRLGLAMTAYDSPHEPAHQAATAQAVLDALPESSRYRDQALAVYGDLAMRRGDYRLAARIWLTLQQGDEWHAGRAAAGLGLPLALEGLAEPGAALDGYRRAAHAFEARLAGLEQLAGQTRDSAWTARLLAASLPVGRARDNRREASHATAPDGFDRLPGVAEAYGNAAWLAWLADEDVSRLLGEWQTLTRLQDWLDALPVRLEALEQVKDERTRRSQAARSALAEQDLLARRDALVAAADQLEDRIAGLGAPARALDAELIAALADSAERKALARIERLGNALAAAPAGSDQPQLAARIARLEGVVIWDVAESRSSRVRGLGKELAATRDLLGALDTRVARLERAEAELAIGAVADFHDLTARASTLGVAVAAGLTAREEALAGAFREALEREIETTGDYLMSARVAIARTTDLLAAAAIPGGPES